MSRVPAKVPLKYWRAALAEAGLYEPTIPQTNKPIEIAEIDVGDDEQWIVTNAAPDVGSWVKGCFKQYKEILNRDKSKEVDPQKVPLVMLAARLSDLAKHGIKRKAQSIYVGYCILCIPCLLDRNGGLWPDPDRHPWIPRDYLEPLEKYEAIGQFSDYDEFISNLPYAPTSLSDTFQFATNLFKKVTGACLPLLQRWADPNTPNFELEGFDLVSEWQAVVDDPRIIAFHLMKLYDNIESHLSKPGSESLVLLDRLRTIKALETKPPQTVAKSEKWYAETVGHVSSQYPLSPTQRMAMVELTRLGQGRVLAVNGPPGTGKTTLLHSVVAQMWVDAALNEAEECPLIVVTSTNKKAVENALESFGEICASSGHERWHPYKRGFGLFFASSRTVSRLPTFDGFNHPFNDFESPMAVDQIKVSYLNNANKTLGPNIVSVEDAVKALHHELKAYSSRIKAVVSVRFKLFREMNQTLNEGAETGCNRLLNQLQQNIETELRKISEANDALNACKAEADIVEKNAGTAFTLIDEAEALWNAYLVRSPLWLDFLRFLPPLRRRRDALDRIFFLSQPMLEGLHRREEVDSHLTKARRDAEADRETRLLEIATRRTEIEKTKNDAFVRHCAFETDRVRIEALHKRWCDVLKDDLSAFMQDVSLEELGNFLDVRLRSKMFSLADWYWTGRWLLEMRERNLKHESDTRGFARLQKQYRRFAMLSPCIGSNFDVAPKFFTAWQGEDMPLWNKIDLLIVDEAGQVTPEKGAPLFALAKRALVVGDIYQIEPVWNIKESADRANAIEFGLIAAKDDPFYDELKEKRFTAADGNLMSIASQSCTVQQFDELRGLMLTEHRRCVPELIGYCNELIYKDRLQPLRPQLPPDDRILPPYGYLHIDGQDEISPQGSRTNNEEAKAIIRWLKTNRRAIEEHYADEDTGEMKPFWKLVGIVTPFKAQEGIIVRHLRHEMPDLVSRLTVGTVHKLQGQERPIVVFSPTYGVGYDGEAFFNRSKNMLNVAVSRARDSFLVIGAIERSKLFDPHKELPSGILMKYINLYGQPLEAVIGKTGPQEFAPRSSE
jgi:hypothetical protein